MGEVMKRRGQTWRETDTAEKDVEMVWNHS